MIGTCCLEKILKVIDGQPCLALDLIGVTNVLVIVTLITAIGDRDSLGSPLRVPLVASGTPFCALVCCLG
jgi:hypothetical protein